MDDPLTSAIDATRRAAKELVGATAQLARELGHKAEAAVREPRVSAEKAARRAAKELDEVAEDIERILREL